LILTAAKAARVAFHPCFKKSGLSSSRFMLVNVENVGLAANLAVFHVRLLAAGTQVYKRGIGFAAKGTNVLCRAFHKKIFFSS
jgi:hypothetical protein